MDATQNRSPSALLQGMGKMEFIFLCALLMALNALAIDVMLPALGQIGEALSVSNENHRQYIVSSYLIGFGAAQLFYGPISDRFGRRKPIIGGLIIYILSSLAIVAIPDFTGLLILRFIQGIGSGALRVVTISVVRDIYAGRMMAEVMSLIMMVFMIVPVIAPGVGQVIMIFGNWHLIFLFIAVIASAIGLWMVLRLPETLAPENIRPFTPRVILEGFRIVLTNRLALLYTLASTAILGALFGFVNSAQQVYMGIYNLGHLFPVAFASVAIFMAISSLLNSRLVGRFGMRALSHGSLLAFIATTGIWLLLQVIGPQPMGFAMFIGFFALAMFQFGWIASNFQAMAIEPLGHVAGTASSVLGFISTIGGASIGAVIGQAFDGTALPMIAGYFTVSLIALALVLVAEKGRLFRAHNPVVS